MKKSSRSRQPSILTQGLRPDPQPDYGRMNVNRIKRRKNANNGEAKKVHRDPRACTIVIDSEGRHAWGTYQKTISKPKSIPA